MGAKMAIGRRVLLGALPLLALPVRAGGMAPPPPSWRGANLTRTPQAPLGSDACGRSLRALKDLGADSVALIPFLWQATPQATRIALGSDFGLEELRAGIRQARAIGLKVMVKPHVWVPETWAGAVDPQGGEQGWADWFGGYGSALETLARLAAAEKAEALAIGTELRGTSHRPEWASLIARLRPLYPGLLTYVAHWDGEVARVPFWGLLDAASVSLYPPLGTDEAGIEGAITRHADQLVAWRNSIGKPLWVAELGLRSAQAAQVKPWESPEERDATPDQYVQARVLARWLAALDQRGIGDMLVYRWFSDPDIGGPTDTDFTIQGKRAQDVLHCWFTGRCDPWAAALAEAAKDYSRP